MGRLIDADAFVEDNMIPSDTPPNNDFDVVSWMPLPDSCQKRKASKWIPCSERMPEMHKEQLEDGEYCMISDSVLVTDGNSVFISDYEADGDYCFGWNRDGIKCDGEITHWMPLPKPYREEGIDWPKRVDYEGEVHWN